MKQGKGLWTKKKCDENRPKCSRCDENGVECVYAAVKPRQRRKRDSLRLGVLTAGAHSQEYPTSRRLSQASCFSDDSSYFTWRDEYHDRDSANEAEDDAALFSPLEPTFPGFSITELASVDPLSGYTESEEIVLFTKEKQESPDQQDDTLPATTSIVPRPRSSSPESTIVSPIIVGSPLFEFTPPAFSEFSERPNRRALVDHFCKVLSHLIVFREETGNPFQQLILPLTRKSPPVMNAIFALACAHLEYRGVDNLEKSLYFHHRAIQGVAQLIQQNDKVDRNEVLAAIMLLVYYECLVQKGHSNIVAGHLKGFLTIAHTTTPDPSDPAGIFLERAFRFYDVIAALSNGTAPLSDPPTANCLLPLSPLGAPVTSPLCNVDTLLGMSTTLWPIIHRLSTLVSLKSELSLQPPSSTKFAVLQSEFSSTAQAIERALNEWTPILPADFIPDSSPNAHVQSIYHNALSYRHASLVYLYRTVLGSEREDELVQKHVRLTLEHCRSTVDHKGPMSALLWPLFVASCEALKEEGDRVLAERVFKEVDRRQGMRNIGEAWEVVRGVWARDGFKEEEEEVKSGCEVKPKEIWREVAKEVGVNLVFG
ncbi:fungal-specific transcription factor domain-containing protein [Podospora fimiseda]|uniref:Fungal-specific transcription factor domain-containing protein n=1 Tax=Podospora fimiseda TaxID=252190 RepID=A0AAN7BRL6_9PEZI|nr:fungal-specific transcription factor domain-containing protein [Podospora fimiseda]